MINKFHFPIIKLMPSIEFLWGKIFQKPGDLVDAAFSLCMIIPDLISSLVNGPSFGLETPWHLKTL